MYSVLRRKPELPMTVNMMLMLKPVATSVCPALSMLWQGDMMLVMLLGIVQDSSITYQCMHMTRAGPYGAIRAA